MATILNTDELAAPLQDVVSFAFDRQKIFDAERPLYINADNPQQCLSYTKTLQFVRQMIAGLKACGLEKGDTVIVHLFNSVRE